MNDGAGQLQPRDLLAPVCDIARRAGAEILEIYASDFEVGHKQFQNQFTRLAIIDKKPDGVGFHLVGGPNLPGDIQPENLLVEFHDMFLSRMAQVDAATELEHHGKIPFMVSGQIPCLWLRYRPIRNIWNISHDLRHVYI